MRRAARYTFTVIAAVLALLAASCSNSPGDPRPDRDSLDVPALTVGAIPDQDPQELQRRYQRLSNYLSEQLGVPVAYVPVTDYAAAVTTFVRGDLDLVFFGGLTGVQARTQVAGASAVAQRDVDADFTSVFIANTDSGLEPFEDVAGLKSLAGHSFTFGSESSTSGRLMPQYFMSEAGLSTSDLAGEPGFSGSHDATAKLVEAGTFQAGAMNSAVWDDRVADGKIDTTKVREIFRTPPYHDYHWVMRPDLGEKFGAGFPGQLRDVLLAINGSDEQQKQILAMFNAGSFIATDNANYAQIEAIARQLGLLR